MIRVEILLSIPGNSVAEVAAAINRALYTGATDLEDVVVHRVMVEEEDA